MSKRTTDTWRLQLTELVTDAVAFAETYGDTNAAEALNTITLDRDVPATVVVVGETKRGKSSLVNALVDHKDLLPVAADVATSVYVAVQWAPEAIALAFTDTAPGGVEVPLDEIPLYVADEHRPAESRGVRSVVVGVDHPLLAAGLILVDTPGVGGLDAGHTSITMTALSLADALLFVVDPGGPITGPELSFLREASERIEAVIFVMTKTDAFPAWEQLLEGNRLLLEEHAPRYASYPTLPTSSVLRAEAKALREAGDEGIALALEGESGYPMLERTLREYVIDRTHHTRHGNALRATTGVIQGLIGASAVALRVAGSATETLDELKSLQQRYSDLLKEGSTWRLSLNIALQKLGVDMQAAVSRVASRVTVAAGDVRNDLALDSLEADVRAIVNAGWQDIQVELRDKVEGIVDSIVSDDPLKLAHNELPLPTELLELIPLKLTDDEPPVDPSVGAILSRAWPILGAGMTGQLMLTTLLGPIGPLVGVTLGLGAGKLMSDHRKQEMRRAKEDRAVTSYLRNLGESTRRELGSQLQQHLIELRTALEQQIEELMATSRANLEATIRRLEEEAKEEADQRDTRLEEFKARLIAASELGVRAKELSRSWASAQA